MYWLLVEQTICREMNMRHMQEQNVFVIKSITA